MAYYCLHNLGIKPSDYLAMDDSEKAFIIASINIKVENEQKLAKSRAKNKRK